MVASISGVMRLFLRWVFGLVSLATWVHGVDVYVVAGQSNGWRLSHLSAGAQSVGPVVHYFGMDCVSEPESSTMRTLSSLSTGTMGYGLADALRRKSGGEIVFVQYCRCGAPVTSEAPNSWFPGEDPENGKVFEAGLMVRFERYIKSVREQVEQSGRKWEVKGVIWHQGESDVSSDKTRFEKDLKNVFARFRRLLGADVPIVAGHIRDLGERQRAVNEVLDRLASQDPLMATVGLDGVTYEGDDKNGNPNVHINREGCHTLGRSLAKALDRKRLASAVVRAGGRVEVEGGEIVSIDLYNGNNPLKGKGGKNEAVTDDWLAGLAGCTSLRKLHLTNCAITNAGLVHLKGLTGIEDLNLTLTPVSDEGLGHLSGLSNLRNLGLASTQCTGSGFANLRGLKRLENVNFHFTPLDDGGLAEVVATGVSGRLWFAHTKFSDEGAACLSKLKDLRICGLGSKAPGSSGAAVAHLKGIKGLEDLSLLDNQADIAGIQHAAEMRQLRRLDVSYAPMADDECLRKLASLPVLGELSLGGSSKVTGAGLLALAGTKSLKKLTLGKMKNVGADDLARLRQQRPDLEVIEK